ncbi:MAG: hypothetical protein J0H64_09415 [Actinobacteria bacterium]|nr:hypothetical protein [Actinomycetota bacterium]
MSAQLIFAAVSAGPVSVGTVLANPVLAAATKPGSPPPITFVVTAFFAIAIFLLGFDLVRRLRRSRFREEIRENLAAELAERDAQQASSAAPGAGAGEAESATLNEANPSDETGKA